MNQFSNVFFLLKKKEICFKITKTYKKRKPFRNEKSIFKVIFKDYYKFLKNSNKFLKIWIKLSEI